MIVDVTRGDVFNTALNHIAFGIAANGYNTKGFSAKVCKHVPGLRNVGVNKLGSIITFEVKDKKFHGIVCYKTNPIFWSKAPNSIRVGLNRIHTEPGELIAIVLIGSSALSRFAGANLPEIVKAIHASKKRCVVYSFDLTKEKIMDIIEDKSIKKNK
ncbi:hypothetical protein IT403_00580 [Candidatus Nomurabacteria bacterium]|nr:hypothetical protein [Candidatus Nomurabacteria bacterium]